MTRVNRFRMPFLLTADEAARRIARAIAAKRRLAVIPWQMALVSILLRLIPGWLYDRIASRAPRKPRDVPV
jgi:short-subunit dehydrogenase